MASPTAHIAPLCSVGNKKSKSLLPVLPKSNCKDKVISEQTHSNKQTFEQYKSKFENSVLFVLVHLWMLLFNIKGFLRYPYISRNGN